MRVHGQAFTEMGFRRLSLRWAPHPQRTEPFDRVIALDAHACRTPVFVDRQTTMRALQSVELEPRSEVTSPAGHVLDHFRHYHARAETGDERDRRREAALLALARGLLDRTSPRLNS